MGKASHTEAANRELVREFVETVFNEIRSQLENSPDVRRLVNCNRA